MPSFQAAHYSPLVHGQAKAHKSNPTHSHCKTEGARSCATQMQFSTHTGHTAITCRGKCPHLNAAIVQAVLCYLHGSAHAPLLGRKQGENKLLHNVRMYL